MLGDMTQLGGKWFGRPDNSYSGAGYIVAGQPALPSGGQQDTGTESPEEEQADMLRLKPSWDRLLQLVSGRCEQIRASARADPTAYSNCQQWLAWLEQQAAAGEQPGGQPANGQQTGPNYSFGYGDYGNYNAGTPRPPIQPGGFNFNGFGNFGGFGRFRRRNNPPIEDPYNFGEKPTQQNILSPREIRFMGR